MIKKYNQFIGGKVNEDLEATEKEKMTKSLPYLSKIGKKEVGEISTSGEEEEETSLDKYTAALQTLADMAGVNFDTEKKEVIINGKVVIFPAETEKYHVKGIRKGFSTPEEVISAIGNTQEMPLDNPKNEISLESKSYKSSRFKKLK